jgi:NADP-dependent 3-hydroxy acid dehydrogenase YdfG
MVSGQPSQVAWVTGASKGIGFAIASALAKSKYTVFLTGRNHTALEHQAALLRRIGHDAYAVSCDVTSEVSVVAAYRHMITEREHVDLLINNAGVTYFTSFEETTVEQFDHIIDTNLRGTFLCIKQVLPAMLERQNGMILNIVSVAATTTYLKSSAYAASKAGMLALSRGLRAEVRKKGIRVIDILPGAVETEIWPSLTRQKFGSKMIRAEDIASLIVQVCQSPETILPEEIVVRPIEGDL